MTLLQENGCLVVSWTKMNSSAATVLLDGARAKWWERVRLSKSSPGFYKTHSLLSPRKTCNLHWWLGSSTSWCDLSTTGDRPIRDQLCWQGSSQVPHLELWSLTADNQSRYNYDYNILYFFKF